MKHFANLRHAVHKEQLRQKEWAKVYSGLVYPGDAFVFYDGETTLTRDGWIEFAYYPITCKSWEELWRELASYPFANSMKSWLCPEDCRLQYAQITPVAARTSFRALPQSAAGDQSGGAGEAVLCEASGRENGRQGGLPPVEEQRCRPGKCGSARQGEALKKTTPA